MSASLRRGLCSACYQRERRGSPAAAADASCVVCGLADGRLLRAVQLGEAAVVCCRNHGWLAERTSPKPASVLELLAMCRTPGDRRGGTDRRDYGERRHDERREALDRRWEPREDAERRAEGRRGTDARE